MNWAILSISLICFISGLVLWYTSKQLDKHAVAKWNESKKLKEDADQRYAEVAELEHTARESLRSNLQYFVSAAILHDPKQIPDSTLWAWHRIHLATHRLVVSNIVTLEGKYPPGTLFLATAHPNGNFTLRAPAGEVFEFQVGTDKQEILAWEIYDGKTRLSATRSPVQPKEAHAS
jgi:hypothetical protein